MRCPRVARGGFIVVAGLLALAFALASGCAAGRARPNASSSGSVDDPNNDTPVSVLVASAIARGAHEIEVPTGGELLHAPLVSLARGATATITVSRGVVFTTSDRTGRGLPDADAAWLAPCDRATLQRAALDDGDVATAILQTRLDQSPVAIIADPGTRAVSLARAIVVLQSRGLAPVVVVRPVAEEPCLAPREERMNLDDVGPTTTSTASTETSTRTSRVLVRASLPKQAIREVIREDLGQFVACYEHGLERAPGLAGKVVVHFRIENDGAVREAKVSATTLGDREVEACVVDAMSRLVFPKPEGGGVVEVTYPFTFAIVARSPPKPRLAPYVVIRIQTIEPRNLSLDLADAVLQSRQRDFAPCARSAKQDDGPGTASAKLDVDRTGRVANATITETSLSAEQTACIVDHLGTLVFPPPTGRRATSIELTIDTHPR